MKTLAERLESAARHYTSLARRNYRFAYTLVALTILSSAVAGVAGISKLLDSVVVGILALVPALSSLATTFLKPQGRANWHYKKAAALAALYRRLTDQGIGPDKVSEEWTSLDTEMDKEWEAKFGLDASSVPATYKPPQSN